MDILKKHTLEIVGSFWLIIVAVQFIFRYFLIDLSVDFTYVYWGMLCITAATGVWSVLQGFRSRKDSG